MAYKSARLLQEAINREIDELRKLLMMVDDTEHHDDRTDTQSHLIELRKLIDEMTTMADRPAIDDVTSMSPGDYVKTMKPLVGKYHRQLFVADVLPACLCEDLQANAVILMLIDDEKTVVRAAHDPNRPEVALAVEAVLASLDDGTKAIAEDGAAAIEEMAGLPPPEDEAAAIGASGELEKPATSTVEKGT